MKRWTSSVQHTLVVCLFTATCGCVGPRGAATDTSAETQQNALPAERAALAEGLARYSTAVSQDWNRQSDAAFSNFLRAAELDPDNEDLQFRVALGLIRDQRADEARAIMEQLAKRHPRSEQAQLWTAFIERITGQPEAAIAYYEQAIKAAPDSPTGYMEKAAALLREDRAHEAIELLQSGLKRVRDYEDMARLLAQIHVRQIAELKDPEQIASKASDALRALAPIAAKGPRDEALLMQLALLDKFAGDYQASFEKLEQVEELLPPENRWRQRHVTALFRDDLKTALPAARQFVEKDPDNPRRLLTLGHLEEQARNFAAAEVAYRHAMVSDPKDLAPVLRLGLLLSGRKRLGEAQALFTGALTEHPKDARLLELMAYLEVTREDPKAALDYFDRAAGVLAETGAPALTPHFEISHALACLQADRPDEAARLIKESFDAESDLLDIFVRVLLTERNQQRVAQGLSALQQLSELEPNVPSVYVYLGLLRSYSKHYSEAIESFTRAEELAHEQEVEDDILTSSFYFWFGAARERNGQFDQAVELFKKCIALEPLPTERQDYNAYVDALNYLAYMQAERGLELDKGLELINQALTIHPNNAAYIDTRGWIYFMQGKYAEARDEVERALSIMPDDSTITDHLGDIYEKLGVIEEAVDWWKKSFMADPTNEKVAEKLTKQNVDLAPLRDEAAKRADAEEHEDLIPDLISTPALMDDDAPDSDAVEVEEEAPTEQ